MKHLALVFLSLVPVAQAAPQWVEMPGGVGVSKYVDPASRVRTGEVVRVTELMNFQSPRVFSGAVVFSIQWTGEYHCGNRQTRVIAYQAHGELMGGGTPLVAGAESVDWSDVLDGSLASGVWAWACTSPTPL